MLMIGCDFRTRFQQIAVLDTTTGEITERWLQHETGEAKAFYIAVPSPARVGMEATGHALSERAGCRKMRAGQRSLRF